MASDGSRLPVSLPARLPTPTPSAYGPLLTEGAGELLQRERSISEADLRGRIADGARILRVVVVEVAATADYLAYLRLSTGGGYCLLAMRRYEGARAFSDFRTLRRTFAGWGYSGPLTVYPEGHPRFAALGIAAAD